MYDKTWGTVMTVSIQIRIENESNSFLIFKNKQMIWKVVMYSLRLRTSRQSNDIL